GARSSTSGRQRRRCRTPRCVRHEIEKGPHPCPRQTSPVVRRHPTRVLNRPWHPPRQKTRPEPTDERRSGEGTPPGTAEQPVAPRAADSPRSHRRRRRPGSAPAASRRALTTPPEAPGRGRAAARRRPAGTVRVRPASAAGAAPAAAASATDLVPPDRTPPAVRPPAVTTDARARRRPTTPVRRTTGRTTP